MAINPERERFCSVRKRITLPPSNQLSTKLLIASREPRIADLMIPVSEAIQLVRNHTRRLATEKVPLIEALDRVLAEDILADSDLPPFDRSQMDGYAVRAEDVKDVPAQLRIVGESSAGSGCMTRCARARLFAS